LRLAMLNPSNNSTIRGLRAILGQVDESI
jgi:hypothetical protein